MSTTTDTPKAEKAVKPLPWLRLYTEAVDDEKLRLLAFEDRWHFIALLCCKGQGILGADDGTPAAPLVRRKLAVKLGLEARAFDEAIRRMAEVDLIDAETLQPKAWSKRQHTSDADNTAAERKRRQRERDAQTKANAEAIAAAAQADAEAAKSAAARDGHGSVTDPSRVTAGVTVTACHGEVTRTDTDTDKETEERKHHSVSPDGDTGGSPPPKAPEQMTKDELWAAGKSILAQGGMPAAQCGSFVGSLVRDYGPDIVVDAVRAAVRERPADAPGYLTAACQRAAGQRRPSPPSRQQALESNNRAVADRLAAAGA